MAGKNQHYIPQNLLRGFAAYDRQHKKKTYVWVYRKGMEPHCPATDGVGSENYFYSPLSSDGTETLDDLITRYETEFSKVLSELRSLPVGAGVSVEIAAELVSHLILRGAHFRTTFHHAFEELIKGAMRIIGDSQNAKALMGLDGIRPKTAFKEAFRRFLEDNAPTLPENLPFDLIEYAAFLTAKENYDEAFATQIPILQSALPDAFGDIKGEIKKGHNRLLAEVFFPAGLVDKLALTSWWVVEAADDIVLPDCVAVQRSLTSEYQPLLFSDPSTVAEAFLPISARRILVGTRGQRPILPDIAQLNRAFAECSHSFFVAARSADDLRLLQLKIGGRSTSAIQSAVDKATARYAEATANVSEPDEFPAFLPGPAMEPAPATFQYQMSFSGSWTEEEGNTVGEVIKEIVAEAGEVWPLNRLDGATFAADYDGALRALDRGPGFPSLSSTIDPEVGEGMGMVPAVTRDGVLKFRVVARDYIARGLVSTDADELQFARQTLLRLLSEVGFESILLESVPGLYGGEFEDPFIGRLFSVLYPAFGQYAQHRLVAGHWNGSIDASITVGIGALRHARKTMFAALRQFAVDQDYSRVFDVGLQVARTTLMVFSQLAGELAASGKRVEEFPRMEEALTEYQLARWFAWYRQDLETWWSRIGDELSLRHFLALLPHVDRILAAFGLLTWKTDGQWLVFPTIVPADVTLPT